MTEIPESHRALLDTTTAILTTVGTTGVPHSTAVWFLYDEDGDVKMWLSDARQKMRNLARNSKCSFLILDPENPGRYLALRGHAELVPDPDVEIGKRLCAKYQTDPTSMLGGDDTRYAVVMKPFQVMIR